MLERLEKKDARAAIDEQVEIELQFYIDLKM
jgi:hypothetical protein